MSAALNLKENIVDNDQKLLLKADKSDTYTRSVIDTNFLSVARQGDSYLKSETYS